MSERGLKLLPYLLALIFALWGLRTAGSGEIIDPDAARHAMNGAFFLDMLRDGQVARAVEYAKTYYSRLPAISIPYHPPLFPLLESFFFFGLGVNVLTARLLVALSVFASGVLLYKLILKTHASHLIAVLSTATFLAIKGSQRVAADVMLEFPMMALLLAALHYLVRKPRFEMRNALLFALFASAAAWTKQNALFLGGVPIVYLFLRRRWHELAQAPVWVATGVFGAAFAAVVAFSKLTPLSANSEWPHRSLLGTIAHNVPFYLEWLGKELGVVTALICLAASVAFALTRDSGNELYIAWTIAALGLLAVLPPSDPRYLFHLYPGLIVAGYSALHETARAFLSHRRAWAVPAVAMGAWAVAYGQVPEVYLRGPSEAARTVAQASPSRVLYCGRTNGPFIFALRALKEPNGMAVIRGDKLPEELFSPNGFESFAHDFGIEQIVIERNTEQPRKWDELFAKPLPSMQLVREIPLSSSDTGFNGQLRVFRFTKPSPKPKDRVTLKMMSGEEFSFAIASGSR